MQGIAATLSGTMRGIGRQKIGLMNAVIGIYLFGIPVSYMAAFYLNLEVNGLWLGCGIGVTIVISLHIMYLVSMADWRITDRTLRQRALMVPGSAGQPEGALARPLDSAAASSKGAPDPSAMTTDLEEEAPLLPKNKDREQAR